MPTCPVTGEQTVTRNYMRITAPGVSLNEFVSFSATRQQALDWILDNAPKDEPIRLIWNPYMGMSPDMQCVCGWVGERYQLAELRAAPYVPGHPMEDVGQTCPRCGSGLLDALVVRVIVPGMAAEAILEHMADMRFTG